MHLVHLLHLMHLTHLLHLLHLLHLMHLLHLLYLMHLHCSEVGVPEQQSDRRVPGQAPAGWAWCRGGGVCHHPGEGAKVLSSGAVTVWCR